MSDTSYEENIANRLRNRLDGTFLDKAAADVIDSLLARQAPAEKPLICRDPLCPIKGAHKLHDEPCVVKPDPIGLAKWLAEQYWEGECGDLDAEAVQSALVEFGIVSYRKPTDAEFADPEWWGHEYDMQRDDEGVGEFTPEFKAAIRIAKEDAEAERIDNSQFGVGA